MLIADISSHYLPPRLQNAHGWDALLQWLHSVGIHLPAGAGAASDNGVLGTQTSTQIAEMGAQVGQALQGMDMAALLALAAAIGWASGLRLYMVVFALGLMGWGDWVALPAGLQVLAHPAVLLCSGFMLLVEFFADKVPWLDSIWDALNALVRVPGGALLAAAVLGADDAVMAVVSGLLGGSLAATSLATKMTTRAALNASPEPFSNWGASLAEDGLVIGALWLAVQYPLIFAVALVLTLILSVLLMVWLFRFLRLVLQKLRGLGHRLA